MSKPDILSRIERDEEFCVQDGQEAPATCIGDGQEPPQTHIRDGQEPPRVRTSEEQEPPQSPEEMDQTEEALGEDEVPMEADTGGLGGCQEEAVPVPALSGHGPAVSLLEVNNSEGLLTTD